MLDIGGTNVKLMVSGRDEVRKVPSGRELTAEKMVQEVTDATSDWKFDTISIGFPGLVENGRVVREPLNLGAGWVDFEFERAFGKPVRIINDATMQAIAHYVSGRMLFIGFGTSIGATLIVDHVAIPMELGLMKLRKRQNFVDRLSEAGLERLGRKRWQGSVEEALTILQDAFRPAVTVIGGGNAKLLDPLPTGCERGHNRDAFVGATRLWPGTGIVAEPRGTSWWLRRE